MSLDSIMQVLWGGEISSLALIVTLLPLICQSLGDRYYLSENLSKYILNKKVVLKNIFIVSLVLNLIVLVLVLIPTLFSVSDIFKNTLLILSIVLLSVFFVYLFRKTLIVIKYLNDEEEIKKEIKGTISDKLKKLNQQYISNGEENIKTEIKTMADQWFKYSHKDYYDAKDTISSMVEMIKDDYDQKIKLSINNTINHYISIIYKHGQMSIEDITNLLILWNNGCNANCFKKSNDEGFYWEVASRDAIKLLISDKIFEKICSKEENNIAYGNSEEFQKLKAMITYSKNNA